MDGTIIHIAGLDVQVGAQLRQRCSWCGAVLLDYDLTRVASVVAPGEVWSGPSTWPVGALIETDGCMSSVVEHDPDKDVLPDACCAKLPAELTSGEMR